MAVDWHRYCKGKDFAVEGNDVVVQLRARRQQRVTVHDEPDAYLLVSRVASRVVMEKDRDLTIAAWGRNRHTELVGFYIDKGRLMGSGWVPKAGLTADEFQLYLRAVAGECDRYEFQLTGKDGA